MTGLLDNREFFQPMFNLVPRAFSLRLSQCYQVKRWQKFLKGNLAKSFFECENMVSRKMFRYFLHADFFFSFNLELICACEFFKSWNCTYQSGSCNFSFLKNSLVQINAKLNRMITYTYLIEPIFWRCKYRALCPSNKYSGTRLIRTPRGHAIVSVLSGCLY